MKNTTKLLSLILALIMIVPILTPMMTVDASAETAVNGAWDGSVATSFAGGDGSTGNPYQIATPAQLAYFASLINDTATSSSYIKKSYILTNDIDLGNREWMPIAGTVTDTQNCNTQKFGGVLNGNGYTISNLYISKPQIAGVGLFSITGACTIKDLTLQGKVTAGMTLDSTSHIPGIGLLMGTAYGGTYQNLTVYTNVAVKSSWAKGAHWVGGVAGYITGNATFTDCNVFGTVETKLSTNVIKLGGVVGQIRGASFTNVHSYVDVIARDVDNQEHAIGGFAGYMYSNADKIDHTILQGCSVNGNVGVHGARGTLNVGGLIGVAGNTPQTTEQTDEEGNKISVPTYWETGGKGEFLYCSFDGEISIKKEGDLSAGTIRQGLLVGLMRTYTGTIRGFMTSAEEGTLYNTASNYTYDTTPGQGHYSFVDDNDHIMGISVSSDYGVAVRLTPTSPGLRFNSMISKSLYDSLASANVAFSLGTLITPTAYVEAAGAFTTERLDAFAESEGFAFGYVDVPFDPAVHEWLNTHLTDVYDSSLLDDHYFFSGALSNIVEQNYNRTFSGVGYITITNGGYKHTFYADYTDASRSRTVGYVATAATNDRSETQTGVYQNLINDGNENGAYSPYTALQLQTIRKYVDLYEAEYMNTEALTLIENGKSDYVIVYPFAATDEEFALAAYLQHTIRALTGVELPMRENVASSIVKKNEIVVGCNERASSYSIGAGHYGAAYSVTTSGSRVLILGEDADALSTAVLSFVNACFGINLTTATSLTKDTSKTVKVDRFIKLFPTDGEKIAPLSSLSLSGYRLIYSSSSYVQKRMSVSLQERYSAECGVTLNAPATSGSLYNRVVFQDDTSLKNGDWKIATTKSSNKIVITVSAGTYYGFEGAEDYLIAALKYGLAPVTTSGFTMTGNYKSWIGAGREAATQYAYQKNGSVRLMYYNVLWGESQSSKQSDGSTKTWYTPTTERNDIQATVIAQYMPDVLACQEFNLTRRGGSDYAATGNGGLVAKLAELGYAEAIDPRVKNVYTESQKIPGTNQTVYGLDQTFAEATAGSDSSYVTSDGYLKGYGQGGYSVTYGGETFYTWFNCTPLFYNQNTTTCETGGYYWYKAQWNRLEEHDIGWSDCASKAATWGLFTNRATGDQYIVIGTHMCTRNNYIRELQARELVALINDLTAQYNVPVFLGGDFNGRDTDSAGGNYRYFVNVAGYTDLQSTEIAGLFSSSLISNHSYPDNTNTTLNILQPSTKDSNDKTIAVENTYFYANAIDRILTTNDNRVAVSVFGIVFDEYTRVGSDHMPVFCDFSLVKFGDYTQKY